MMQYYDDKISPLQNNNNNNNINQGTSKYSLLSITCI